MRIPDVSGAFSIEKKTVFTHQTFTKLAGFSYFMLVSGEIYKVIKIPFVVIDGI